MLETMRSQAQSWIAKLILGGIVLSFALWGIGDYFLGSRLQTIAEVDGEAIPDVAFHQAYERQLNTYRALLGKQFSKEAIDKLGLKQDTLQTLINRRIMVAEAAALNLAAPQAALLAKVRANPAFQSAGAFDPGRYQVLTRNMGFRSPADYEQEQRVNLMVDALQRAVMNSGVVSEAELRARFASEYEQRVIAAVIVDPLSLEKSVKIDDKQARDFYEANRDQYRSPLRLRLVAVRIDAEALARDIAVSDDDVQQAFAEMKDRFSRPERRHARHILVRVAEDADAATRAAAKARIEAALKRIKAGEDFAEVAKGVSEDTTTAAKGGDLGFFSQGAMVPAFDAAAFAMQPGEVSDIIESQFGYHIIQLLAVQAPREATLAEVRDDLVKQLKKQRAQEEAYNLAQDLDDALGRESNLKAAARSLNLPFRDIGPISLDEALADDWLGGDAAYRGRVFGHQPGDAVEVDELADGRYMAVEVIERIDPEVLPFAKVAVRVYADARRQQATMRAQELADTILAKAGKQSLDDLAQAYGQPKFISKPVRRNGIGDDAGWLTTAVLDAAFRVQAGRAVDHVIGVPQGLAVAKVERVIAAPEDAYAKQAEALRAELKREKGAVRFARWMASVRDRHDIKVNQDLLARL